MGPEQSDCGEAYQTPLPEEELAGKVPLHGDGEGQEPQGGAHSGNEYLVERSLKQQGCVSEEERNDVKALGQFPRGKASFHGL